MTALTTDRNTPRKTGYMRVGPMAAGAKIFAGALLMRDGASNITQGKTATDLVGLGRAEMRADNTDGVAGARRASYRDGIYQYANSAGADAITAADIGALCYAVDDQTVAKTNGGSTRSPAGFVSDVDDQGVWVRFDEALTRNA